MTDPTPIGRVEWRGRTDFAEVAEALGVPTNHIMGTVPQDGRLFVMFTLTLDPEEPDVYSAGFSRGVDGILRQVQATLNP